MPKFVTGREPSLCHIGMYCRPNMSFFSKFHHICLVQADIAAVSFGPFMQNLEALIYWNSCLLGISFQVMHKWSYYGTPVDIYP